MKIGDAYPSPYLKASEFEKDTLLTMARVDIEEVAGDEHKPVLYFHERTKGVVLNRTNARTITEAYGEDTDEWSGQKIVVFQMMTQNPRGEPVMGIRVRKPKPPKAAALPNPPSPKPAPTARRASSEIDPPDIMDDDIGF